MITSTACDRKGPKFFLLFNPDVSFKHFPLRDETAVGTGSVSVLDTTELLDEDHGYPDYPGIVNVYPAN